MKKFTITLLGLLFVCLLSTTVYSQCWVEPACTNEINFTGQLTNQNYNGSTCFSGSGQIKNSVNVNNWSFLSYTGSIQVDGPLNMNNKANAYANGSIIFDQVHFSGGDTLFVDGAIIISKVVSNNSNTGSRNTIILSKTSSLIIDGKPYKAGDIITTQGNSSNEIDILACDGGSTLPVHISAFAVKGNTLSWTVGVEDNIDGFVIQGSQDAQNWVDIDTIKASGTSYSYSLHNTKMASLGLIALLLIGLLIPSKKLKVGALCMAFIGLSLVSCSKEAQTPQQDSYKYYRLKVLNVNGSAEYSSVIHK